MYELMNNFYIEVWQINLVIIVSLDFPLLFLDTTNTEEPESHIASIQFNSSHSFYLA